LKETLQPMKKTPTPLSHNSSRKLPIIRILSEEEELFVKLNLEMEDETHDILVKWGKEVASDEDYVSIAIRAGLEEYVDALDNKQK